MVFGDDFTAMVTFPAGGTIHLQSWVYFVGQHLGLMTTELMIASIVVIILLSLVGLLALSRSISRMHDKYIELDRLREIIETEFEKKSLSRTRWGITLS